MTERQTTERDAPLQRPIWPYIVVCLFFGFGFFLRPDLFLELAVVFFFALIGVSFLPRSERLSVKKTRVHETSPAQIMRQYHALIDGLQFPVYLLDHNANLLYCNQNAITAFGPVKTGDQITIPFRQPQLKRTIEDAISRGVAMTTSYNEPVPDDRWFQVEISPIPDLDEKQQSLKNLFLLAFHDQTEARRIDQMRSDFIANASHELRTPLASLLGYIETIKGPARDDIKARDRFIDVMLDQAERMSRLVNDLLSLSRIEMKAHVKPSETIDLREVLRTVIASLQGLAKQMQVEIELKADEKLFIVGDHDELVQVFENLVENACKYGQEGERVCVTLEKSSESNEDFAVVSVRDYGMGIAFEHQHRITERFYRVDVARSREKQGTGLGLAIVKH
ncbi:MAG: histidine kinase dimerization/phospho-acceptor domain-containing protein, partial [Pseudomonadota bacterium]